MTLWHSLWTSQTITKGPAAFLHPFVTEFRVSLSPTVYALLMWRGPFIIVDPSCRFV